MIIIKYYDNHRKSKIYCLLYDYHMIARNFVPKHCQCQFQFLVTHGAFQTSYEEDKFMRNNVLNTRKQWTNYSVSGLQQHVGQRMYINWPSSLRRKWKAAYANYLTDTVIEKLYVPVCC